MIHQPKKTVLMTFIACLNILVFFTLQTYSQDDEKLIEIPVVFHVLYGDKLQDNGINSNTYDVGNSTMYLPKEKIEAELADLDKDFQKLNTDLSEVTAEFKKVVGNPKVHFYLSEIKYVEVKKTDIQRPFDNKEKLRSLSPVVDSKRNLNVYISIIKHEGKTTNGVTPVKTSKNYSEGDVVNLNYKWVGLGYRLLTHEVGHWLGLWHTWDNRQHSYGVDDIPLQKTYTNMSCEECPPDVKDQLKPNTGFKTSNYNNFMDYSGCRSMFSLKQSQRIRKVIKDYRPEIWKN